MDHATPNLPSRDFDATAAFYGPLGFEPGWRSEVWMILRRGTAQLEFFRFPDLDPATSSFGACLRLDDVMAFYRVAADAGVPERTSGIPRLEKPRMHHAGVEIGYLVDPDGTLISLLRSG